MATIPSAARVAALRERRAALGLVRVEVWVRPEHVDLIRSWVYAIYNAPEHEGLSVTIARPPSPPA
jgi:hypothetical protein